MRSEPSKQRKGQGQRAKGSQGKTCGKCGTSHPPRECQHCRTRNVTSTAIKIISVQIVGLSSQELGTESPIAHPEDVRAKVSPPWSRPRSKSVTKSAHSIESASFQDHLDDLHGKSADPHGDQQENLHGTNSFQDHQESTDFVK